MKYVKDYLLELNDRGLSENSIKAYERDIKSFLKFIRKPMEQVETSDINRFIKSLEKKGRAPITINRKLTSISGFKEFISDRHDIDLKIIFNRKKLRKNEFLPDMFSLEDFKRLVLKAYEDNDKRAIAIFYTFFLTGVRVSELKQFKINKLFKNNKLSRKKSDIVDRIKIIGKGDIERTVTITEELKYHISNYVKVRKGSLKKENMRIKFDELFTGTRGNLTRQTINKIIKQYASQTDRDERLYLYHAHNFRHLCAVFLLDSGYSIDKVSKMLGHRDLSTTMIYTKESFQKNKEELDKTHQAVRFW